MVRKGIGRTMALLVGLLVVALWIWQPPQGAKSSYAGPAMKMEGCAEKMEHRMARVGSPAPDFELPAYADGSFKIIKLSDYKGQWVVLCFYPGDFTFV